MWLAGAAQSKNLRSHPHMPPLAHTPLKVTHLARHTLLSAKDRDLKFFDCAAPASHIPLHLQARSYYYIQFSYQGPAQGE